MILEINPSYWMSLREKSILKQNTSVRSSFSGKHQCRMTPVQLEGPGLGLGGLGRFHRGFSSGLRVHGCDALGGKAGQGVNSHHQAGPPG